MSLDTYIDAPVTRAQVEAGAWVRPEHAASALGVDERTIRRRVRSGSFARTEIGGRVYVRQAPTPQGPPREQATDQATTALALVVREQAARLEQLFRELGHLEHERNDAKAQATTALAQLEHERRRVAQVEEQLARARAQAAEEQARATRLEAIAQAPWYAVRVRRRLRRELAEVG